MGLWSPVYTLGHLRRRRVFSSFNASSRPSVLLPARPSVHPSARPERRYCSYRIFLRISAIGLECGGMIIVHWVQWSRSLFKMAMLGNFYAFLGTVNISMRDLTRSEGRRYHSNSLRISNLFGWCRWLFKIALLSKFLHVHGTFRDRLRHARWIILGNVRKSYYGLKFIGMMQCTMKQITI